MQGLSSSKCSNASSARAVDPSWDKNQQIDPAGASVFPGLLEHLFVNHSEHKEADKKHFGAPAVRSDLLPADSVRQRACLANRILYKGGATVPSMYMDPKAGPPLLRCNEQNCLALFTGDT